LLWPRNRAGGVCRPDAIQPRGRRATARRQRRWGSTTSERAPIGASSGATHDRSVRMQRGRARANRARSPIGDRDNSRNSAACTQSGGAALLAGQLEAFEDGAVVTRIQRPVRAEARRHVGYPTPVGRCTLRRVAGAAQHGGVRDVERRTAGGERHDVIDGQVGGGVGGALVARAPLPALTTPGTEHAGAEPLPGPRAVEGVVSAAVGQPCVLGAAATRAAGDDTADRAQLQG
jgi:hypothetical protein